MDESRQNKPTTSNAPASLHRRESERRANRAVDCIEGHLIEELTLEQLAAVAAFSSFHFHRVFAAITSLELRHDFEMVTVGGQLRCELCLPVGPP